MSNIGPLTSLFLRKLISNYKSYYIKNDETRPQNKRQKMTLFKCTLFYVSKIHQPNYLLTTQNCQGI